MPTETPDDQGNRLKLYFNPTDRGVIITGLPISFPLPAGIEPEAIIAALSDPAKVEQASVLLGAALLNFLAPQTQASEVLSDETAVQVPPVSPFAGSGLVSVDEDIENLAALLQLPLADLHFIREVAGVVKLKTWWKNTLDGNFAAKDISNSLPSYIFPLANQYLDYYVATGRIDAKLARRFSTRLAELERTILAYPFPTSTNPFTKIIMEQSIIDGGILGEIADATIFKEFQLRERFTKMLVGFRATMQYDVQRLQLPMSGVLAFKQQIMEADLERYIRYGLDRVVSAYFYDLISPREARLFLLYPLINEIESHSAELVVHNTSRLPGMNRVNLLGR